MATEPNRELNNATTLAFVGKVVGGSSAVNGMQAPRGTKDEYNRWAEVYGEGAEGWGWDGMLPYFKKASTVRLRRGASDVLRDTTWLMANINAIVGHAQADPFSSVAGRHALLQTKPGAILGPRGVHARVYWLADIPVSRHQ